MLASVLALMHVIEVRSDWLVDPAPYRAEIRRSGNRVTISNGLVERTLLQSGEGVATLSLRQRQTSQEMLRAVEPEAAIVVDGRRLVAGGLIGQADRAFVPTNVENLDFGNTDFRLAEMVETAVETPFDGSPGSQQNNAIWPPKGKAVELRFESNQGDFDLGLVVRYELYDGVPLFCKRVTVLNRGTSPVVLDSIECDRVAFAEADSDVNDKPFWYPPNIELFTDLAYGASSHDASKRAVTLVPDPAYGTQVNYNLTMPSILVSAYPVGPSVRLEPGKSWRSHRTFELLHDSTDRERRGLTVRKAYRALAPWAMENPLLLHVVSVDDATVRSAIDQCADVGFEMVILSFGSGLNMEDVSEANITKFKALADYAHSKGVRLGGYSLLASRSISPEVDVLDKATLKPGRAIFGNSPCLATDWGDRYFENLKRFLEQTGFDLLEHDGSYPGDTCASTAHSGHRGYEDSLEAQYARITEFYHWCRRRGISLNVPDWYFLQGSTKSAMGYRETNWSLPRAVQHIHCRQNLFDGTWEKTPSMGWMFVPLVEYQGGGAEATIEPLRQHLEDYRKHLENNLLFGAQACYRGTRLYDSEETREVVKGAVSFYKAHRDILESDIVHLRRADGKQLDGVLHANPTLEVCGMAAIFNPTDQPLEDEFSIPLRYCGLAGTALVQIGEEEPQEVALTPDQCALIRVRVPPNRSLTVKFRKASQPS